MAPRGKSDEKIGYDRPGKGRQVRLHRRITPTNPSRVLRTVRRAIHVAREFGATYVQAYTSCNIEYSIPTPEVMKDAFEKGKGLLWF